MRVSRPVLIKRSSSAALSTAPEGRRVHTRWRFAGSPGRVDRTIRHVALQLWRFARPHTIIGTTLSVAGLYAIAVAGGSGGDAAGGLSSGGRSWAPALLLATTWLASFGANVFVVGLNQLYDVPIDRINKPYLPLASGALSRRQAWAMVMAMAGMALGLAARGGPILLATISLCMLIGTLYSLPPVRLKRFALPAALCIVAVRGAIVNPGIYLSFAQAIDAQRLAPGRIPVIPSPIWVLTGFMIGLSLAIAIAKDMPDIEGDRRFAVNTLAVRLGPRAVFRLSCGILVACYAGMIGIGLVGLAGVSSLVLAVTHSGLLLVLALAAQRTSPDDPGSLGGFYRLMWRLFYAEYVVFPLACVL